MKFNQCFFLTSVFLSFTYLFSKGREREEPSSCWSFRVWDAGQTRARFVCYGPHQKVATERDEYKKKARHQHNAEEEAVQLYQIVADLKEKVEATKAAKARAAESRRLIDDLQSELAAAEDQADTSDQDSDSPVSKADIGALVASSIQTAVSILLLK